MEIGNSLGYFGAGCGVNGGWLENFAPEYY